MDANTPSSIGTPTARIPVRLGLSARLLLLTAAFVMLAEVLISVPSIAAFRRNWLGDRIAGAQMVALSLDGQAGSRLPGAVEAKLLEGIKARAIAVRGEGTAWLAPGEVDPARIERTIDLRSPTWPELLAGALQTLTDPSAKPVRLLGEGMGDMSWVEVILDERQLREAMLAFSRNLFAVSLVICAITAGLVYMALHFMIVRPVRRLAGNVAAFAAEPENASRIIVPSVRRDEIGLAERAVAAMETALSGELRHKRRLADLGLAVSKINHELRNMLATAQLLVDRLGELDDPTARRIAPRLMATLSRAVEFCEATLSYGRARERVPQRQRLRLAPLVAELVDADRLGPTSPVAHDLDVPEELEIDADPEHLWGILFNLLQNAHEAFAGGGPAIADPRIVIAADRENGAVRIVVADNGPGVAAHVRDRLFSAFQGSTRSGGTGLGLPVAEELVRLHGGTLTLEDSAEGARFVIVIPDRPAP